MRIIKTLLVLFGTISIGMVAAQSCCCTGAGANYSILPNLDKHIVGLRYSFGSYNTMLFPTMNHQMTNMDMSMMGPGTKAVEHIHTLDLFARFNLPKRFQVSVFVPAHLLAIRSTPVQRSAGLGDASLLVQYSIFDPLKCHATASKHQLRLGAGVKAPTGKFTMTDNGMFATDLQLGTGSVDFIFSTIYTYRFKQFGLNLAASYKKNLVNKQQFRFGDKMKFGTNAFYIFQLPKDVSIMPTVGLSYNYAFVNRYQKEKLTYTGGSFLSHDLGVDIYYKQFALSTSVSPVLLSVSNWVGAPYPTVQFEAGVYYSFATDFKHRKSTKRDKKSEF